MAISPVSVPLPLAPVKKSVLERLPGKLPEVQIPGDIDLEAVARTVLEDFPNFDESAFTDDAIWRDSYALTGTFRTFYSKDAVSQQWSLLCKRREVSRADFVVSSTKVVKIDSETSWVECGFRFTTAHPVTECSGFLSLVPSSSETGSGWRIWVLRTVLEQLPGHGSVDALAPCAAYIRNGDGVNGDAVNGHAVNGHATTSSDTATNGHINGTIDSAEPANQFFAVIVGGGQAGLSVGGRLQALGVPYVILEANKQVGDAWRLRYKSARLHTIREYSHLPFDRTFGPSYPEYLGKEELAIGHRLWAEKYGINVWLSTKLESGHWDAKQGFYTLSVRRDGSLSQITAKHVVIATGAGSQTPVMPTLLNRDKYQGLVLHSAQYNSAVAWKGKSGIVVGTANTGHDVADDMCEAGMAVTMVQRNRTFVLPLEYIEDRYNLMYNCKTPTEISDRIMFTNPVSISRLTSAKAFHAMARAEPERWEALERAGFKVDPYGDIQDAINVRLGGHYIDVGTSAKISKGLIKVKSNAPAIAYTEDGLEFADGEKLKADVIVFATGFIGNLRRDVERLLGKDVADRAGDCFGLNEEGEILGAYKPVEQPGLWYIGGALGHARWYSRFLALSIKADQLGTPLPVYTDARHKLGL